MLKKIVGTVIVAVPASALSILLSAQGSSFKPDASRPVIAAAEYERWQKELSNWGRWGKEDELGTLNLITPAKRKQAAALVKDGVSISLASNESTEKEPDNPCPVEWGMLTATASIAMDRVAFPC